MNAVGFRLRGVLDLKPRRVVGEQCEVVDVAQVRRAKHLGDEVVEAVESQDLRLQVGEERGRPRPPVRRALPRQPTMTPSPSRWGALPPRPTKR